MKVYSPMTTMAVTVPAAPSGNAVPDGITEIEIGGFKSILHTTKLGLGSLTVLAGTNSSGKSSMMQGLLLLKQTLESPYNPGDLQFAGPNVFFTSADQFFSNCGRGRHSKHLSVGLTVAARLRYSATFEAAAGGGVEVVANRGNPYGKELEIRKGMTRKEMEGCVQPHSTRDVSLEDLAVTKNRFLLSVKADWSNKNSTIYTAGAQVTSYLRNIIHVPGLRGFASRVLLSAGTGNQFPGQFQSYVPSLLDLWQASDTTRIDKVAEDLRALGLASAVKVERKNATELEILVSRHGSTKQMVNVVDTGLGVSQAIPISVALRAATKGALVYIEQPELHLHPKAQVEMARLLASAAASGARVVVETHSDLLLLGIRTCAATGVIEGKDVLLHWFDRDKHGVTSVRSTSLDRAGAFGDWPVDFTDVSLKAHDAYLDAAMERLPSA